jgi:hypothetical protein
MSQVRTKEKLAYSIIECCPVEDHAEHNRLPKDPEYLPLTQC